MSMSHDSGGRNSVCGSRQAWKGNMLDEILSTESLELRLANPMAVVVIQHATDRLLVLQVVLALDRETLSFGFHVSSRHQRPK